MGVPELSALPVRAEAEKKNHDKDGQSKRYCEVPACSYCTKCCRISSYFGKLFAGHHAGKFIARVEG